MGIIAISWACNEGFKGQDVPVAKVYDKFLTRSELKELIPRDASREDSLLIAQSYINKWITKELLLHKAQQNLTDAEKNIRKQVEDYSSSLLIHKYKEKLIAQKLSANISDGEINRYYEEHKYNFVLNTPIVRAVMAIIPKSAPNLDKARKWFASKEAKDLEALEEYCITNARKYDNFNDEWIEFCTLQFRETGYQTNIAEFPENAIRGGLGKTNHPRRNPKESCQGILRQKI